MKKIASLLLFIFMFITLSACTVYKNPDQIVDDLQSSNITTIKLSIDLTAPYFPEYRIIVDKDYNYYLYKDNNIFGSKDLSDKEKETVDQFIESFSNYNVNSNNNIIYEYWFCTVTSESKSESFYYTMSGDEEIDQLLEEIINLSPNAIADLQKQ